MSKQYAHLHAMAKTSVKFQNDWPKTVGGVALTRQLLTNGRVTARLYRTCVLTQVRQKMAKLFANSGDPDQMPRSAASDLGLHCLPITRLRVSRLQWVNDVE